MLPWLMGFWRDLFNRSAGTEGEAAPPRTVEHAEPTKEETPPSGEVGVYDSRLYTQKDFPRYNPDALVGRRGWKIYRKMLYDDQLRALTLFKRNAVISRAYNFKKDEDNPEHDEQAIFFSAVLDLMEGSFAQALEGILTGLDHGFSVTEKVFDTVEIDGKQAWGLRALKLRPFDSFRFKTDKHGNIVQCLQMFGSEEIDLPLNKIIHFVNQPQVDPQYGESELSACYEDYWSKSLIKKFRNIHLERHGSGFLWAQIEGTLPPGEKEKLERLLDNVSGAMSAAVPKGVTLNMEQPSTTTAFEAAIADCNKAMARSLLVPNLLGLSEQGKVGSFALGKTQFEAFLWILSNIGKRVAEVLNEQLFKPLALWNFGTADFPPFYFEPMSEEQKRELVKTWGQMIKDGAATQTDDDEAYLRELLGFPEKPEDIEETPPEVPPLPGDDDGPGPEGGPTPNPDADDPDRLAPDNDQWVAGMEPKRKEHTLKAFAAGPWLKRVDFAKTERLMDRTEGAMGPGMAQVMGDVKVSIYKKVSGLASKGKSFAHVKLSEILALDVPPGLKSDLRRETRNGLRSAFEGAYSLAAREIPAKAFAKVPQVGLNRSAAEKFLGAKSHKITGDISQKTISATQNVLFNALKYDWSLSQTITALDEDAELGKYLPQVDAAGRAVNVPARLENIARTSVSEAINSSRDAYFKDPALGDYVQAYDYSAILDTRTTEVCRALHGLVRKDWGDRTPPNHHQCRSLLVPVTILDNWDGKQSKIPAAGTPQAGFGR